MRWDRLSRRRGAGVFGQRLEALTIKGNVARADLSGNRCGDANTRPPPERPTVDADQPHSLPGELGKATAFPDRHVILVGLAYARELIVAVIQPIADITVRDGKPLQMHPHADLLGRLLRDADDLGCLCPYKVEGGTNFSCA